MTYVARAYDEVVRDMLTTLTGGVVSESIPVTDESPLPLTLLSQRPVRRISHLVGVVDVPDRAAPGGRRQAPYRFTSADFELVAATNGGPDGLVFRRSGRTPAPGSTLVVNYYPVSVPPAPLTDLNVGSVVRTLVETFSRELATMYQHLAHVYDSAFVDTAEGSSLDRVVALVGAQRLAAGHPVVAVRITRHPSATGRVTVPANTPLVAPNGDRYLTTLDVTLEPGETTRALTARGETPATVVVAAGELRPEVVIAGVAGITNPDPARLLVAPESDDDLRRRSVRAFVGTARGTVDALRSGLLAITGVTDAVVTERPDGQPGTLRVTVAYGEDTPETRAAVAEAIEALRPAGIRVLTSAALPLPVAVTVALTVDTDRPLAGPEMTSLRDGVEARLTEHLAAIPPGGKVRRAQLARVVLDDQRLVDAVVTLTLDGAAPADELTVPAERVLAVRSVAVTVTSDAGAPDVAADVEIHLPLHLASGTGREAATSAVRARAEAHIGALAGGGSLTVDGLLAAVRDDGRYAAVRADVVVTVTAGERFFQLSDGSGSFAVAGPLRLASFVVEAREGTV